VWLNVTDLREWVDGLFASPDEPEADGEPDAGLPHRPKIFRKT
jgi:hypothetical protein